MASAQRLLSVPKRTGRRDLPRRTARRRPRRQVRPAVSPDVVTDECALCIGVARRRKLHPTAAKIGVRVGGWHDFRHTLTRMMRRAGVDPIIS